MDPDLMAFTKGEQHYENYSHLLLYLWPTAVMINRQKKQKILN